jgi:hypothetical protein
VVLAERDPCGTGFSREGVGRHAAELRMFTRASSRLKPVPLKSIACIQQRDWLDATHVGPALAGKASGVTPGVEGVHTGLFPAEAGPTEQHRVHPAGLAARDPCGTGFSREGVMRHATGLRVSTQASSRLKPVPLKSTACIPRNWLHATHVGLALAGKASGVTPQD